jgi:hypothetical protein
VVDEGDGNTTNHGKSSPNPPRADNRISQQNGAGDKIFAVRSVSPDAYVL